MEPRLIAIIGPLKGTIIPLVDAETIIGREPSNRIAINDPLVSRKHCVLRNIEGKIHIADLESLNGTFLNGVPAGERVLENGDRIRVGSSQFIFLEYETGAIPGVPFIDSIDEVFKTSIMMTAGPEDSMFLQPDHVADPLPPDSRFARDLAAVLRISTAINAIRKAGELQARVLEMIFEVIPVERGAFLLALDNSDQFVSGTYRERESDIAEPFRVSRTVVRRVFREGIALIANDILTDQQIQPAESLVASQIRSLLCVPVIVFGSKLGVIYADTTHPGVAIDEHHLHMLTAIASIAAVALEHARYVERLEDENRRLIEEINIQHDMIGESARMRDVYQFVNRVTTSDSTVLIRGESGTGKELVARAIHRNSKRSGRAIVAINCAALTESLLESELFGHERGAFTGAVQQKKGKIEIADGGTLFLDEVGELAPQLQAKLLRVLQEREFERVGGTRPIKVDIRLIAATNRELEDAIKAGQFRADLYYRLNVVSLILPPLRERREDIPLLASYFVQKYSSDANRTIAGISREAQALLNKYDWPGNVRELANALERAVVLGSSDYIRPEDLPEALVETAPPSEAVKAGIQHYHEAVNGVKRQLILSALEQAGGSFTEAAKLLDLHPNYLHRLVRNMDLRKNLRP
ncbi:MAG TPA: sigma 54-interacting transcriptional regulator [Terriglobia bacterium]|jgi:Nif-specific regulatory protein